MKYYESIQYQFNWSIFNYLERRLWNFVHSKLIDASTSLNLSLLVQVLALSSKSVLYVLYDIGSSPIMRNAHGSTCQASNVVLLLYRLIASSSMSKLEEKSHNTKFVEMSIHAGLTTFYKFLSKLSDLWTWSILY